MPQPTSSTRCGCCAPDQRSISSTKSYLACTGGAEGRTGGVGGWVGVGARRGLCVMHPEQRCHMSSAKGDGEMHESSPGLREALARPHGRPPALSPARRAWMKFFFLYPALRSCSL